MRETRQKVNNKMVLIILLAKILIIILKRIVSFLIMNFFFLFFSKGYKLGIICKVVIQSCPGFYSYSFVFFFLGYVYSYSYFLTIFQMKLLQHIYMQKQLTKVCKQNNIIRRKDVTEITYSNFSFSFFRFSNSKFTTQQITFRHYTSIGYYLSW